jgi:DNA-binding XRE family transcriptional regulator
MAEEKPKHPGGRPTKFKPEYVDLAEKYALLGATDSQMAQFFDVTEQTLNSWKSEFPEFLESLKRGKEQADAHVSHSLYWRARGYSHASEKIFCTKNGEIVRAETVEHYPPDPTSMIFWLKNRRPKEWRDKTEVEASISAVEKLSAEDLKKLAKEMGLLND